MKFVNSLIMTALIASASTMAMAEDNSESTSTEYFVGAEAAYTLTEPGIDEAYGPDSTFDKTVSPGVFAGVVLNDHHKIKVGYLAKDIKANGMTSDVDRFYTQYDYLYPVTENVNLFVGAMAGYDDYKDADEYSDLAVGAEVGAEYRINEFGMELAYQKSVTTGHGDLETIEYTNGSSSSHSTMKDDNLLMFRVNYYF